jgi:hypothetical protein
MAGPAAGAGPEEMTMSQRLYAIDLACDSIPYPLVKACRQVGFQDPEDVRWCRVSHIRKRHPSWRDFFHLGTWKALFGRGRATGPSCTCGQELPELATYAFTLNTGREEHYLLGQCSRCRTMVWEEP